MAKKIKKKNKTPRRRSKQNLERGTRSKAIHEYLGSHPDASPRSVVAALEERGINVSSGLVTVIKYRRFGKTKTRVGGYATHLLQLKKTADTVGGIEKVRQILDLLEQLM